MASQKQTFSVQINSQPETVWATLWNEDTYPQWTEPFAPGSRAESDWKEGSKVLFLDGKGQGMVSRIAELQPNTYMSFEHLGEVMNGVEDTSSPRVKEWAGARENYRLQPNGNRTNLVVDIDITHEMAGHFQEIFPKALQRVKELAEAAGTK
jgi:uncharacterized protein YndB with AHSA1/START domain